jgi:hypothetical protein
LPWILLAAQGKACSLLTPIGRSFPHWSLHRTPAYRRRVAPDRREQRVPDASPGSSGTCGLRRRGRRHVRRLCSERTTRAGDTRRCDAGAGQVKGLTSSRCGTTKVAVGPAALNTDVRSSTADGRLIWLVGHGHLRAERAAYTGPMAGREVAAETRARGEALRDRAPTRPRSGSKSDLRGQRPGVGADRAVASGS